MNKSMLLNLWLMVWSFARTFAMMTNTKVDDNLVSAFGTEEMFEEFWKFLADKGWVVGQKVVTKTVRADLELPEKASA